jgi:hypothetical protein
MPDNRNQLAAQFNEQALRTVQDHVERLRTTLSYADALRLPEATGEDIVVSGREVQLTIFRQIEIESLRGQVLVTVQVARFGLGGTTSYQTEKGLVFSAAAPPRDATEDELRATAQRD